MQTLKIDPIVPYLIPPGPMRVILVGCGGTGSHLAQSLARLAVHAQAAGQQVELIFIDGDTVELKNVGRQLFSTADIGMNKAQALAARFSAVFGLPIIAWPDMADTDLLRHLCGGEIGGWGNVYPLLIGAVDSTSGRQALAGALAHQRRGLWLDAGNHEQAGQVCVGSAIVPAEVQQAFRLSGLCQALPAPSLQFPELLVSVPPRPRADCAQAVIDNAQSLMVNQAMAAIAAQYAYQIVMGRRLTTFQTTIDLASLTMRSLPITATALASICPPAAPKLKKTAPKKGRVAA